MKEKSEENKEGVMVKLVFVYHDQMGMSDYLVIKAPADEVCEDGWEESGYEADAVIDPDKAMEWAVENNHIDPEGGIGCGWNYTTIAEMEETEALIGKLVKEYDNL